MILWGWCDAMTETGFSQRSFAVKSKDDNIRLRCTSGGIFLELSRAFIAVGGVVYGCAFDDRLSARHVRCETFGEVERCVGSKYSQSDMGTAISDAIADLKSGKHVLFTGTPCQIAGLRSIVPAKYMDRLLMVDLVCHGAPSPVLFQQHLGNVERSRGKTVVGYSHRPKNKGWGEYLEIIEYSDGGIEQGTRLAGVWKEIFYSDAALRPSCYSCPWLLDRRPGDITIGDYWGIEHEHPDFRDSLGVSLVIVNSEKGKDSIDALDLNMVSTSLETATKGNPNLLKSTSLPERRRPMWDGFIEKGFSDTIRQQKLFAPLWKHAYRKIKPLLRRLGLLR